MTSVFRELEQNDPSGLVPLWQRILTCLVYAVLAGPHCTLRDPVARVVHASERRFGARVGGQRRARW